MIKFFGSEGKYAFLSNFYDHPVKAKIKGTEYTFSNGEAMFHALKAIEFRDGRAFKQLTNSKIEPVRAKAIGRHVKYYDDKHWAKVRVGAMERVERAKFSDPELREKLIQLSGNELAEDNPYDAFWGLGKRGKGENHLGKILTKLSNEFVVDKDNNK